MAAKAREKISLASEVTSIVSVIPVVWLGLAFFVQSVSDRAFPLFRLSQYGADIASSPNTYRRCSSHCKMRSVERGQRCSTW